MSENLIDAMANLEEDNALALVKKKLMQGETAYEIVEQCRKGVEIVGKRYSEGTYYLSDLIMSEAIFKEVMDITELHLPKNGVETNGVQVIMGTIEGDIHDLGKNIVIYLLRSSGYRSSTVLGIPLSSVVKATSSHLASRASGRIPFRRAFSIEMELIITLP